jgi:hypothetical protein
VSDNTVIEGDGGASRTALGAAGTEAEAEADEGAAEEVEMEDGAVRSGEDRVLGVAGLKSGGCRGRRARGGVICRGAGGGGASSSD